MRTRPSPCHANAELGFSPLRKTGGPCGVWSSGRAGAQVLAGPRDRSCLGICAAAGAVGAVVPRPRGRCSRPASSTVCPSPPCGARQSQGGSRPGGTGMEPADATFMSAVWGPGTDVAAPECHRRPGSECTSPGDTPSQEQLCCVNGSIPPRCLRWLPCSLTRDPGLGGKEAQAPECLRKPKCGEGQA